MAPDDTDPAADHDTEALARKVIEELDPGTVIDNKVILSRRQALGLASGALSLGAIAGWGSTEASAQAAGQVGTESEPVDVEAYSATVQNELVDPAGVSHTGELADADALVSSPVASWEVTDTFTDPSGTSHTGELADAGDVTSSSTASGYELTVDGDTYQFNE